MLVVALVWVVCDDSVLFCVTCGAVSRLDLTVELVRSMVRICLLYQFDELRNLLCLRVMLGLIGFVVLISDSWSVVCAVVALVSATAVMNVALSVCGNGSMVGDPISLLLWFSDQLVNGGIMMFVLVQVVSVRGMFLLVMLRS